MATYIIAKCIRRESNPVWSFVMNYSGRLSGSFHFWRAPIAPGYRHSNPLRRLLRLAVERVYPYPPRMQVAVYSGLPRGWPQQVSRSHCRIVLHTIRGRLQETCCLRVREP